MRMISTLAAAALIATPIWAADGPATIAITGEGHVAMAPDMATVTIGVQSEGDSAKAALDANTTALANVIGRLKDAAIEPKDIQTSGLTLGPRIDYGSNGGEQKIVGYAASNLVTVRVRTIGKVGAVLDQVVSDGANTLNGVTFGLADERPATDEARKEAVADARRKAELYAEAAGVKIGKVLSISEQSSYQPPMPMARAADASFKGGAVPVEAGELGVIASVSIVYEIKE